MEYSGTYLIIGPPGTGKTTFLGSQVQKIVDSMGWTKVDDETPCPVVLCSLTKAASAEISSRGLPVPKFQIGTLHSHAYRQLGKATLAETKLAEWNALNPGLRLSKIKHDTDEPGSQFNPDTVGDAAYERLGILRHTLVDPAIWPESVKRFSVAWEKWKTENGLIDYTDMISMAIEGVPTAPGNPSVVIADECQDLSALEVKLLKKWGAAAGALMMAGDPWQSLYVWRGAHPEMFNDAEVEKSKIRVLGQSYRVSAAVHRMATSWIKQLSDYRPIDYKPTAEAGSIETVSASWRLPEAAIDEATKIVSSGKSVMFAASCSYMLSPVLKVLRDRGIPFSNPWRTKKGNWNPLGARHGVGMGDRILDFLRPDPGTWGKAARLWTGAEVASWAEILKSSDVLTRGAKKLLDSLEGSDLTDEYPIGDLHDLFEDGEFDSLMAAVYEAENGKPLGMIRWIKSRLLPAKAKVAEFPLKVAEVHGGAKLLETPRLHIGTYHSFKGAESDHVFLCPDLSPAGTREWTGGNKQRDSVIRMFYVGITRARTSVHLCYPVAYGMAVDLSRYIL